MWMLNYSTIKLLDRSVVGYDVCVIMSTTFHQQSSKYSRTLIAYDSKTSCKSIKK